VLLAASHHAATSTTTVPAGHTDFYVAAAATFPVLVLALVLQTRFPEFFKHEWQAYLFGFAFVLPAVAGWAAAIAALAGNRDTGWGRAVVCIGLGAVAFILFGSMLTSRFLKDDGEESWPNLTGSLLVGLVLLGGSAVLGAWAIGAV
jgi:hypothetical protein